SVEGAEAGHLGLPVLVGGECVGGGSHGIGGLKGIEVAEEAWDGGARAGLGVGESVAGEDGDEGVVDGVEEFGVCAGSCQRVRRARVVMGGSSGSVARGGRGWRGS
ncbi:MAG: hypothetical protein O2976_06225, partial [Actinomycetota bacterium]|nr:hypothetical protein [Actinomycetota bacterium]